MLPHFETLPALFGDDQMRLQEHLTLAHLRVGYGRLVLGARAAQETHNLVPLLALLRSKTELAFACNPLAYPSGMPEFLWNREDLEYIQPLTLFQFASFHL